MSCHENEIINEMIAENEHEMDQGFDRKMCADLVNHRCCSIASPYRICAGYDPETRIVDIADDDGEEWESARWDFSEICRQEVQNLAGDKWIEIYVNIIEMEHCV